MQRQWIKLCNWKHDTHLWFTVLLKRFMSTKSCHFDEAAPDETKEQISPERAPTIAALHRSQRSQKPPGVGASSIKSLHCRVLAQIVPVMVNGHIATHHIQHPVTTSLVLPLHWISRQELQRKHEHRANNANDSCRTTIKQTQKNAKSYVEMTLGSFKLVKGHQCSVLRVWGLSFGNEWHLATNCAAKPRVGHSHSSPNSSLAGHDCSHQLGISHGTRQSANQRREATLCKAKHLNVTTWITKLNRPCHTFPKGKENWVPKQSLVRSNSL